MEAIRGAASMGRRPCSGTARGTRRGGPWKAAGGKKLPAARAKRTVAGNAFPPAAFRAPPAARGAQHVPRGVYEHGRLPMDAAPRIASMNFAIAYTLIYYPIKVMAGNRKLLQKWSKNWSRMSSRALVSRAKSHQALSIGSPRSSGPQIVHYCSKRSPPKLSLVGPY